MGWYRTGTITLVAGSDVVLGAGTAWVRNALPGDILSVPGAVLEVKRIVSDGELQLATAYTGAGGAGLSYALVPTQGYVPEALQAMQQILGEFGDIWQAWQAGDLQGRGLVLKGSLDSAEDLPEDGNAAGDGYLVAGSKLYVWTGTEWRYAGEMVTSTALLALKDEAESSAVASIAGANISTAAAAMASNSLAATLAAGATKASIAFGMAASATGDAFWVRPGGVDGLKVFTAFLKTGEATYQRLQLLPDGTAFAVEPGEPLHVFRSQDDWDFAFFNSLGELLLSGLGGRSVQEMLLEIGRQLYAAKVSPHLFVIQDSDETEVAWVERDGRLMLPLTGGVALQDWVRVAVEALVKGNPAAPFEVTVGDVGAFALRYDGEVEIPNLNGRTLQEVLRDVEGKLGGMANLSLSPSALPLGDNTPAVLVRNMADPLYAPTARLYVAIPSVVKAGGRLWCAYTASRSVAVNSGEEPGSFCVVAISEDDGLTWVEILVIAHPLSTGRVADPTLTVRAGWHGALSICYFQSGSNVAYDEAVSTWEIVCDNPAADPSVMAWTKPAKLAYGMFVTSPARVGGADLVPVFVIGDTLASAHVKRQHLNLNRGVDIYRRFEGALLPFARIPYDGPRSGWSWLEPSIQQCPDGSLLALVRYADGLYFQRSLDGGTTWGVRASITAAPGIDATVSSKGSLTTTSLGHLCLVWNNASTRVALTIALSWDGGETWTSKLLLSGAWLDVSYPSVCHEGDVIHVVFDRERVAQRRIYHVKLSLAALLAGTQVASPAQVNPT